LNHTLFIDASAMSTVHPIDEAELTEVGQDGTQEQTPPCPETSTLNWKDIIMNSKLLFAATIAASLVSTVALAGEATLPRVQISAAQQLSEYGLGADRSVAVAPSGVTRAQVVAELGQWQVANRALVGPNANRTFNPYGLQVLERSTLTRAEVNRQVLEAAANGTLQRTDYDYGDSTLSARQAEANLAPAIVAQR
jgi:hypothetical protein